MGRQQPWVEWLKKLPVWISGAVGLATAIIGFIHLLEGDCQLGATVLAILTLAGLFSACLYLAFARRPPKIPEGKGLYLLGDKYRPWAFVGIGFILGLVCAILVLEQSRSFVIHTVCGTPMSTPTLTTPDTPTPTPTPVAIRSEPVAILTYHETYITAMKDEKGWNWELRAETDTVGDWEKFTLIYLDNGKVALMTDHGRFVSATGDDGCCNWILRAETLDRGESEEFTQVDLDDGRVAFKTNQGRYVSARSGEERWRVVAQPGGLHDWEKFELIPQ